MDEQSIAVLGAGSWGTALAKQLSDQGHEVRLWARRVEQAAAINETRQNETYLPGFELAPTLSATASLETAIVGADMILAVVPSHGVRSLLEEAAPLFTAHAPICAAIKGIENSTLMMVSQIFEEKLPKDRHHLLSFLGGPSFAKEVAGGMPTAVCVAGKDDKVTEKVQHIFNTDRFRAYATEDVVGVELGGALKNVIAIAAGISDGLGFGHNTRAALITRGLHEISRLAAQLGANPLTMAGLGGMGDLVLTCTGDLSRNRSVGLRLGEGMKLKQVLDGMKMVAEGVKTSKSAYDLSVREGVDMPIVEQVYLVLYEAKDPAQAVYDLMTRLRFRLLYLVLMPAIAVAAAILGYYSWLAMSQYARLGAETIAESTLLLVSEKVDQVEQALIRTDNTVFAMVRLSEPTAIEETWPEIADDETPSVRSVLVLDDTGNVVGFAYRGSENARRDYLKIFQDSILPDLELERQRLWRLKHLHATYDGTPYLISYKAVRWESRRFYVIAQHDTAWIVRNLFPELFATEEGKRLYNVVDQNGNRVYGPSLARAGDYLVGRRFPTTLYEWRLQLAPKQAPLLERQSQTRRLSEAALIGIALIIVLLGVGFVIWAADKERRVNALKAEFIANVSHELKTPLSVVRMFAELLLTKRVRSEEKQEQYLELICRESERLSALIENVLDFAALERGKRSYQLREGHLEDVVTRAIDTFRYRIENEGGTVRLSIEEGLPPAMLDEQAVLLSVINLLDNAVKYGDGTPVEVRLSRDRKLLRVSVRDHGPGIPKEDLRRVFDRFYRTKRNTSDIRGSGIGLSLVKHIAEAHGGKAWAENAEDGGAIVAFTLRAAPVPVAAAETAEPAVL